jgi:aryl-alcohol dehydrogenase
MEQGGAFEQRAMALAPLCPDEVLVRIMGVGICHTDLIVRDQVIPVSLPAVLGHEGAGIVETVGSSVEDLAPGDAVVLSFMSCGVCPRCLGGEPAYCAKMPALNFLGSRLDGSKAFAAPDDHISSHFFHQSSFATYAVAHRRNAVKVDGKLDVAMLGPLGCGIQTGAGAVLNVLAQTGGGSLLVIGAGAVGLSGVMAGAVHGYEKIVVIDPLAARRDFALKLGAHAAHDPSEPGLAERLAADPFENVLDTSGHPAALAMACAATAVRGTCVLVSSPSVPGQTFALRFGLFVQKGITLRGVIEGDADPHVFIPQLLTLYADGRFPFDRLIRRYDFADINEAIADQKEGRCVKPVLIMPAHAH